jgi:hypothetical protein
MQEPIINPLQWSEKIGRYVEGGTSYTGPSTKVSGRVANDTAVQHHIARQLEIIANALTKMSKVEWTTFSSSEYV